MNKPIYHEITFIRAIACLMVVMVHVTINSYSVENGFNSTLALMLNQFSRLGTPIFAVLSAFLLFSSVINRGFNLKKFTLSRTTKIISPYIIWTVIYLTYTKIFEGREFPDSILSTIFSNFILGDGSYHLYFIVTIIQFYLIFPLLQMIRYKVTILVIFLVSLPINYMFLKTDNIPLLNNFMGIEYIINHQSFILNWISYFLFGSVLAYFYQDIKKLCNKNVTGITLLTGIVLLGIYYEINADKIFSSSRPVNLIYIPVFTVFLLSVYQFVTKNKIILNTMNLIGRYSMGIYLVHPLVLSIIGIILPVVFWSPLMIVFTYLLTVTISILLVKLILFLPFSAFVVSVPTLRYTTNNNKKIDKDNNTRSVS